MFTEPHWLILIFPVLFVIWFFKPKSKIIIFLRMITAVLILLALSDLQIGVPSKKSSLVVVADQSYSMPANIDNKVQGTMRFLKREKPANSGLGMVAVGKDAVVKLTPANKSFSSSNSEINPDGSNLYDGIKRAVSLIPTNETGRILILSDGRFTGKDPLDCVSFAAAKGIPIDYRCIERDLSRDLAVTYFNLPGTVAPGEVFISRAQVYSPLPQEAEIILKADNQIVAQYKTKLNMGYNSLVYNITAPKSGVVKYGLIINPDIKDDVPENNSASSICEIQGFKPVLVISDRVGGSRAADILESGGINVVLKDPGEINWTMESIVGYSAVVIDNVSANKITMHGLTLLNAWVKYLGGGVMLLGGKDSFGSGGYYQSPIDETLPLSMDMRSDHRKMCMALFIALDRSGSMSATTGGRTKMDIANLAVAASLDSLVPGDEFGLIAVDTSPHTVIEFGEIGDNKSDLREKVLSVDSRGGGIYVYEALTESVNNLLKSKLNIKHSILFADAQDSENPGEYWSLLNRATKAGITLSVIGLGTEKDCDAEILKNIAAAGKGRIFFTDDVTELPRLFLQDTFVAARQTYSDKPVGINTNSSIRQIAPDITIPSGIILKEHNVCYRKSGSSIYMHTNEDGDESSPIAASWQFGLGKAACLTFPLEVNTTLASDIGFQQFFIELCKKISIEEKNQIMGMPFKQQVSNGVWKLSLFMDPERGIEELESDPKLNVIYLKNKKEIVNQPVKMRRNTADSYCADLGLEGTEVVTGLIEVNGIHRRLPPICQSYSAEYRTRGLSQQHSGEGLLKALADATGGSEVVSLGGLWDRIPKDIKSRSLAFELILLAILVFWLEVAERRLSLVTEILKKIFKGNKKIADEISQRSVKIYKQIAVPDKIQTKKIKIKTDKKSEEQSKKEEEHPALVSSLMKAKRRADRRQK